MTKAKLLPWRFAILLLAILCVLLFFAFLIHLGMGGGKMNLFGTARELFRGDVGDGSDNMIIWRIRFPRSLACMLVGSLLAMVGSSFQALFRNPLAEPYIVGVSSGAAAGGTLAMVTGFAGALGGLALMLTSFVGGLLSLGLVFMLSRRRGLIEVETLLLAGVVVGAFLSALVTFMILVSGQNPMEVMRWLLGSMSPMYWNRLEVMAVTLAIGAAILIGQSKRMNAFAVGEDTAQRLGVNTRRLKPLILVTGTAMVSVAVGSVGVIGFVGLAGPHLARRLLGVDWRVSLIGSALCGSTLMLLADLLAQHLVSNAEIPVGVVTALLGAPFLLILIKRKG